jgi:hypothetical protein
MFRDYIVSHFGSSSYTILSYAFKLYPIWLPVILAFLFWEVWLQYIRHLFFATTKYVVLEIRLPRDIFKSPAAMELVFNTLYLTSGESHFFDRFWDGKVRPWFSAEIISEGGQVRLLMWTRENLRNLVESQIYAQFPDVEIHQVEDYTKEMVFNPEVNNIWGTRYKLNQDDPLPIKSYIDYGLDKDPKEEFKIDPLVSVLEYMSSIKPSEKVWFQIVFRAHKTEKHGGFLSKADDWHKGIYEIREKIFAKIKLEERRNPSKAEADILEGLQRSFQKYPFDVGFRCLYLADKATFSMGTVAGLRNLLRPFSYNPVPKFKDFTVAGFNSFGGEDSIDTNYAWEDFMDLRMNKKKREMLDAYKRRMFYYDPYVFKTHVMTSEALATLFHFPGAVAATPGLARIPSKRAQAPTNLPI